MITLILKTVQSNILRILVQIIIAILFIWIYVGTYPLVQKQAHDLNDFFETLPPGLIDAFGINADLFSNFEAYITTEFFSFVWPILMLISVIGFSSSIVAEEVEKGTIEVLLAQPISRLQVVFSKYISGIFLLIIFNIGTILSIIPIAILSNVDVKTEAYLKVTLLTSLFSWAVFGIGFMFSTFFSDRGKVSIATTGVVLIMYALNVLAKVEEKAADLGKLSLFHYFDYNAVLENLTLPNESLLVFSTIAILSTLLGIFIFMRRDIST